MDELDKMCQIAWKYLLLCVWGSKSFLIFEIQCVTKLFIVYLIFCICLYKTLIIYSPYQYNFSLD